MSTHRSFEELCALSTSGELSREEASLLRDHLAECPECRELLADTRVVTSALIPSDDRALELEEPRVDLRARFLARAQSEGLEIHAGAVLAEPGIPKPFEQERENIRSTSRTSGQSLLARRWQTWALLAGACAACFVLGIMLRTPIETKWQSLLGKPNSLPLAPQTYPLAVAPDTSRELLVSLTAERDRLALEITSLTTQLETLKKQKEESENNLTAKASTAESNAAQDHYALTKQSEQLTARAADLESQLNTLRQQQTLLEASLHSERDRATEYAARLELARQTIRAETSAPPTPALASASVPGESEVGNLVAARNLHIIDVYDSNAAGTRQRAFGRVFYVEGRSLVFYAFDLSAPHQAKNITFHLWGEKAGQKETTLSLGILHDDDPAERRWALTFDDPRVLAKINSVYVTAESKPGDQPRGPKVLYAYFGSQPNHP